MVRAHIGFDRNGKKFLYELNTLTRHAAVLGTTGSGKTVMCKVLVEEALARGTPVIAIDPKGDIGSVGIAHEKGDFRPFETGRKAAKLAAQYYEKYSEQGLDISVCKRLKDAETRIYTPRSQTGIQIALLPDLSVPNNKSRDPTALADLVDPISDSLLKLAGVKTTNERYLSFLSATILREWQAHRNLTIEKLIERIQAPTVKSMGSLLLDDFLNAKERKKLAAQMNVLLTSPSKRAWAKGDPLNMREMLKRGTLNVVDLRNAHSMDDKRFVAEQMLIALYRHMLSLGGTEKLRFILYIDELAGMLPPPPGCPPCKRLLELLIRQGRAFGLGIILATQNPGDIDYKLFSNVGTRFIGKLRTQNDIEKVATTTDIAPTKLKELVNTLEQGEFVCNNTVANKTGIMKSRWLFSYHAGPLKGREVGWVNDPKSRPKKSGKLHHEPSKPRSEKQKATRAVKQKLVSTEQLLKQAESETTKSAKKQRARAGKKLDPSKKILGELTRAVKKLADTTHLKIALTKEKEFVPHLRIVVESKPYKGNELPLQGPYLFDLTSKAIPLGNYLAQTTFRTLANQQFTLEKPKRSLNQAFTYALKEAKRELTQPFYESTILSVVSEDVDEVANANYQHLLKIAKATARTLEARIVKAQKDVRAKIMQNKKKIGAFRRKLASNKAKQKWKSLTRTQRRKTTAAIKLDERRIRTLERENERHYAAIKKLKEDFKHRRELILESAYVDAHKRLRKKTYRPTQYDLVVHATILLVPKRATSV